MARARITLVGILLIPALWLTSHSAVVAHQQKQSFTTLLFNDRTGNLEVSHRFVLHDAEHVLSRLFEQPSDLSSDPASRERFAQYIQQSFALHNTQRQVLQLMHVGHEVDGKYFWVYQELAAPPSMKLYVRHSALQEVWPKQINYVNVERQGKVNSLRIVVDQEWYEVGVP